MAVGNSRLVHYHVQYPSTTAISIEERKWGGMWWKRAETAVFLKLLVFKYTLNTIESICVST